MVRSSTSTSTSPGLALLNGSYAGADWVSFGMAGLVGALLGHSFSWFTGFRGGKGVATAAGGCLVLMPLGTLVAAVVWVGTFVCEPLRFAGFDSLRDRVADLGSRCSVRAEAAPHICRDRRGLRGGARTAPTSPD